MGCQIHGDHAILLCSYTLATVGIFLVGDVSKVCVPLKVLRVLNVLSSGITGCHCAMPSMGLILSDVVYLLHPTQCHHHANVSSSLSVEHWDCPQRK
jgi:hypothetical protein